MAARSSPTRCSTSITNLPGPRRLEDSKTHEEKQTQGVFVVPSVSPRHRTIGRAVEWRAEQFAGDFRHDTISREPEEDEAHEAQRARRGHVRANRPDHHPRALIYRKPADSRSEGRKRQGTD